LKDLKIDNLSTQLGTRYLVLGNKWNTGIV